MYLYGVVKMPPCQDEVFCKDLSNYHWTIFISFPHSTKPTKCTIPNQWLQQYPIHQRRRPRWSRLYVKRSRCRSQTLFYQKFRGRLISGGIRPSTPALAGHGPPMTKREKFKFLSLQPYISYIDQATYSVCLCSEIDLWVAKHCVCSHL